MQRYFSLINNFKSLNLVLFYLGIYFVMNSFDELFLLILVFCNFIQKVNAYS